MQQLGFIENIGCVGSEMLPFRYCGNLCVGLSLKEGINDIINNEVGREEERRSALRSYRS